MKTKYRPVVLIRVQNAVGIIPVVVLLMLHFGISSIKEFPPLDTRGRDGQGRRILGCRRDDGEPRVNPFADNEWRHVKRACMGHYQTRLHQDITY